MPVGLDDGIARREVLPHEAVDMAEHFGKEGLIGFAEGQSVPVSDEAIDKILGKVGAADNSQLAEKGQPSVVQPDHHFRPCPLGGLPCGIGLRGFLIHSAGLRQDLDLLLFGQVLQYWNMPDKPLVRGVEETAIRRLPLPGQGNQFV